MFCEGMYSMDLDIDKFSFLVFSAAAQVEVRTPVLTVCLSVDAH